MTWFRLGRSEGFPSNYGEQHTTAHVDVLVAGLILALVILATAFVVAVLPAYTAGRRWVILAVYGLVSLAVCGIVLVCNFGHEWEVGHAQITSPYKAGSPIEMVGGLGLHVALRGINITLRGDLRQHSLENPNQTTHVHAQTHGENEVIDYNEHYSWEWSQGRFGFGPYAGRISREYRASVIRGSPIPILVTAEYFTFDGEGLRFGRHYRLAGFYAHFFMWVAFCTWALANVGFCMVVRLGAMLTVATGLAQLIAVLLWSCIRNSIEIAIPFESADGTHEVTLKTHYGPDYWLVLVNGVVCCVGGAVLYVLDEIYKEKLCALFGIDPLSLYDYVYEEVKDGDEMDPDYEINDKSAGDSHAHETRRPSRYTVETELGDEDDDEDADGLGAIREEESENENENEKHTDTVDVDGPQLDTHTPEQEEVVRRRRRHKSSTRVSTLGGDGQAWAGSRASSILRLSSPVAPIIIQQRRLTAGRSIYNPFTRKSRLTPPPHLPVFVSVSEPMPSSLPMSMSMSSSGSGPRSSSFTKYGRPLTSSEA